MDDDVIEKITKLVVMQQEIVKDVSEMKVNITSNRDDVYASIEKTKLGISECKQQLSSLITSLALLKWVVGIGLSLVTIALAIVRMV